MRVPRLSHICNGSGLIGKTTSLGMHENQEAHVVFQDTTVSVKDVLSNRLQPPLDRDSFRSWCVKKLCQENVDFIIDCHEIMRQEEESMVVALFRVLMDKYVKDQTINISGVVKKALCSAQETSGSNPHVIKEVVRKAMDEVCLMIDADTFVRYIQHVALTRKLALATDIALWWRRKISLGEFFSFPDPINSYDVRVHAFCNLCLIIANACLMWFLDMPYLAIYLTYGFLARFLAGPRIDPQAFFVIFVFRPFLENKLGIGHSIFTYSPPKRLAQCIGFFFALTATVLQFLGHKTISLYVWLALACALSPVVVFDYCIACELYSFLIWLNVFPASSCDECQTPLKIITKKDMEKARHRNSLILSPRKPSAGDSTD